MQLVYSEESEASSVSSLGDAWSSSSWAEGSARVDRRQESEAPELLPTVSFHLEKKDHLETSAEPFRSRYYIRQKAARREKAAEKKAEKNRTLESISEKKNDDEVDLEFIKEVVESEKNRKDRDAVATPPMLFVSGIEEELNVPEELQGLLNMKRETAIREEGVGEGAREEASQ